MYLSCGLAHTRMTDLDTFWNESIWVEIKLNRESYLIGLFYSPQTAGAIFFDALNKYMEKALDITNNIIILGDTNEFLLNPNMYHLKDVLPPVADAAVCSKAVVLLLLTFCLLLLPLWESVIVLCFVA